MIKAMKIGLKHGSVKDMKKAYKAGKLANKGFGKVGW